MNTSSQKTFARDVFMHIFAIILLYVSTFNFIRLLHEYVNVFVSDPLEQHYGPGSSIRWAIAILLVLYPVYVWASRFLYRDMQANPEKADFPIRRLLLYLTLFLASALMIGDLVALVFKFLEGELSLRFFLKVLVILFVAAAIFGYYLHELRRGAKPFVPRAKLFVRIVSAIVAASVIGGFFVAGSPFRQRLVRFDSQKVSDLQSIQWQIVNFWQQKDRLPENLDELRDDISGFVPPQDSQRNQPYGYRATGNLTFELCAEFNLASAESGVGPKTRAFEYAPVPPGGGFAGETWEYAAGEHCFSRTIDPERHGLPNQKPGRPVPID